MGGMKIMMMMMVMIIVMMLVVMVTFTSILLDESSRQGWCKAPYLSYRAMSRSLSPNLRPLWIYQFIGEKVSPKQLFLQTPNFVKKIRILSPKSAILHPHKRRANLGAMLLRRGSEPTISILVPRTRPEATRTRDIYCPVKQRKSPTTT